MPRKKTVTPHAGQRQLRVGEELRHALAGIIAEDRLSDPDLAGKMITVTAVKISPDLRNATIFITPFALGQSEEEATKLVRGLNRAAGYFRGELARMVEMRVSPQLRFRIDESFETANRIEQLLHDPVVRADIEKPRGDSDDER